MATEYDFIIVGAGPSGSALASRLARTSGAPSVLLIEAGGSNKSSSLRVPGDRFTLAFTQPTLNWGYKTVPQTHLHGQEIDYSRGKGLGGSSSINFMCWLVGARDDFDEWAKRVGDQAWSWENVKERFKKLESFHGDVPQEVRKYINPKTEDHGTDGPINLSYALKWEKGLIDVFDAANEVGLGVNPDINSGNPLGMGIGASTMYQGSRVTSSAYLENAPANLTIVTDTLVAKVLLSGKKAIGIKTMVGKEFFAKKDVILSGGALNTPQLLMLSGIGPAIELEKHGIPVIVDSPQVGKNLQDHCFSAATILQKPGTNDRMAYELNPESVSAARAQYEKDKTGLLTELYCGTPMGWFKNAAVLNSSEFKALDEDQKTFLRRSTVPSFEFATFAPPLLAGGYEFQANDSYMTALTFVMNPQSYGDVILNSADPADAPIIDPKLMSHPYDRRVMIEGMRSLMEFLEAPTFKKTTIKPVGWPKSKSDEDIWAHVSANVGSSWHMCSTARMGKKEDQGACVDPAFRVKGVQNLRVVDLSVIPLLPNNHTQSTAYLVGETAAEKLIQEYALEPIQSDGSV